MQLWQKTTRIMWLISLFTVLFASLVLAGENPDEFESVISDLQRSINGNDLVALSTDIDVLIAESLGGRFGLESVMNRLISRGELEVLCPDTAAALRLAAELGVTRAMVSTFIGLSEMDMGGYYGLAVLKAWILEGMESGFFFGNTYDMSLEIIDYVLGTGERVGGIGLDWDLFDDYLGIGKGTGNLSMSGIKDYKLQPKLVRAGVDFALGTNMVIGLGYNYMPADSGVGGIGGPDLSGGFLRVGVSF
jgi:hypothetical protein